ncbi:hypothetical protein CEXT_625681 [Caerostris extrusa]|uniref:Uncharacterized protein n=1 Tax=Caerostris extrusa TaxID=172846 RepID=A0AAV4M9B1_CAEEX|nr:hypothetical protein CEXT_625681 [Caerostris extrusa]
MTQTRMGQRSSELDVPRVSVSCPSLQVVCFKCYRILVNSNLPNGVWSYIFSGLAKKMFLCLLCLSVQLSPKRRTDNSPSKIHIINQKEKLEMLKRHKTSINIIPVQLTASMLSSLETYIVTLAMDTCSGNSIPNNDGQATEQTEHP